MLKYQKIGEMDSEYPFLFCSKSGFWIRIPDVKVNSFENHDHPSNGWFVPGL